MTTLTIEALSIGMLSGVSLSLNSPEVVCVSGPSGSGKSRLLKAIADLEPHEGKVCLDGTPQASMAASRWRQKVMMVPADSQWWFETVGEHFPENTDMDGLTAFGFPTEVMGWTVDRLSSGERQRLALLRAMARKPLALLLDEPTANLDDAMTEAVETWLIQAIRERGMTVLWVAHDSHQIQRVADHHYCISGSNLELVNGSD